MIQGTQIEIVDIGEFEQKIITQQSDSLEKYFTQSEINYCLPKVNGQQNFAARLAAKRALFRALELDFEQSGNFQQVEILNDHFGKPEFHFSEQMQAILKKINIGKVHLSLTHVKQHAIAMIILEK